MADYQLVVQPLLLMCFQGIGQISPLTFLQTSSGVRQAYNTCVDPEINSRCCWVEMFMHITVAGPGHICISYAIIHHC